VREAAPRHLQRDATSLDMQEMQFYQSIHEEFPEKQTGTIKRGATLFTINKG
jgi:hypothetical protein